MSFVKDSISVFFTRILLFLSSMAQGIIVARILGPSGNGKLNLTLLIPTLLSTIGNLGLGNANLYFIGKKKFSLQSIISNCLTLSIILGSLLLIIFIITSAFLKDTVLKEISFNSILIASFAIPLNIFIGYANYIFLGKQMVKERNLLYIFEGVISLICVVALLLLLKAGVNGALVAVLAGILFASIYALHKLKDLGKLAFGFDLQLFKESIAYGIKTYTALIILTLNYRFDVFLIKYFLTNADVGYYALATSIAEKLKLLPNSVGIITYATVASISNRRANELTPKACRNTIIISILSAIFLMVSGFFLIPLVYGDAYIPSVNAFMILLPGVVAITVLNILHGDLAGRGRPEITIYVFSGALLLNIVLNLFLIPRFGIEGAALASTISYTLGSFTLGLAFSRLTGTLFRDLFLLQKDDIKYYHKILIRFKSRVNLLWNKES